MMNTYLNKTQGYHCVHFFFICKFFKRTRMENFLFFFDKRMEKKLIN